MRTLYDIRQEARGRHSTSTVIQQFPIAYPTLNYNKNNNTFFIYYMWGDYEPVKGHYTTERNNWHNKIRNYK